ncbi:MAG: transcription antitermination factor NusB [Clostridium sp.]|uniref:transcription antitermination factor NusB n=1 Tax=Clostridium sp. DSM 8431 TaxID=1761781 RepID=UPI0008F41AA6|nr:transcription antitermination factor NusB [Clostridium sp. DSM 8431]MCR4944046.1 transcription antitermination factor NusB [Clostridium sp.]SFU55920.1 NusB antitermination factor [Clostridium sp. DSM 8431]
MSRKNSREKAMELAFGMELSKDTPDEALETFVDNFEGNINNLDLGYIKEVLYGIESKKEELDSIIKDNLQNWKIERIAKINLTILRLAVLEMKYIEDVPSKVALNEALELTKKYSDEKSVSFVNAVLDKVLKSL